MTLEQRIEALEKKVADLTILNGKADEIKIVQTQGSMVYAAHKQAAPVIEVRNGAGIITSRLSRI